MRANVLHGLPLNQVSENPGHVQVNTQPFVFVAPICQTGERGGVPIASNLLQETDESV